jgi:hypothetical protein
MRNVTPRSGEELDSESIGHRALAKIKFACKVKLPDARIAYRAICWWGDVIHSPLPIPHTQRPLSRLAYKIVGSG